jgi:gliding motility-associated-like protein
MYYKTIVLAIIGFLAINNRSQAQYIVNGNASIINCHCYKLTDSSTFQKGSVWNSNKIDLSSPFDFSFDINFGCGDANGADGIAFILQPISTSIGSSGSGLGFQGISPSVGILMDTWQNTVENDPTYDHISINKNGDVNHSSANNLVGPVTIIDNNINAEDCQWHVVRIVWNPSTTDLIAYIDGVLRVQTTTDIINTIFSGNPLVYWGFSAATGGSANNQKFCTRLNSQINANINNNEACFGQTITFNGVIDAFIPLTDYYWDFGDNTNSILQNPPPHLYTAPGQYTVKFVVKAVDGCSSDTAIQIVTIGAIPQASFTVNDTCFGNAITLQSTATVANPGTITEYVWLVDGVSINNNNATITNTSYALGNHTVQHYVKTNYGCISSIVNDNFTVYPKPAAPNFTANDVCDGSPTSISSSAAGLLGLQFFWIIDGVPAPSTATFSTTYTVGMHTIKHYVKNTDGCVSDTAMGSFQVLSIPTANFLVNDTCAGKPIILTAAATNGNITQQWYVDGILVATTASFSSNTFTIGVHNVKHIVKNGICTDEKTGTFTVYKAPQVTGVATTACFGFDNVFTASLINPPVTNPNYHWLFSDNSSLVGNPISKTFTTTGTATAKLYATSGNGCSSDTVLVNYNVVKATANAGNDTLVIKNTNFTLNGSGNGIIYNWQPASFFSNGNIANPATSLIADQTFTLTVTTVEGCIATDAVFVKVFNGSKIYVPNVFTPNGDGVNEVLKPTYIGIASLAYFTIYNRWGRVVFTTQDLHKGWDANFGGKAQSTGTYIWMLKAIDLLGTPYQLKGNFILIR